MKSNDMKDLEHYKFNIADSDNSFAFKQEPNIYPTVNQDGCYRYQDNQTELGNPLKKSNQTNHLQIVLFVTWILVVLILLSGLVFISFWSKHLLPRSSNNYLSDQARLNDELGKSMTVNTQYIIVSRLVKPLGCSFYLKPDVADGLFIEQIEAGGPADQAGLSVSDQVLRLDNEKIKTLRDVLNVFNQKQTGDRITVIYSRDGVKQESTIVLDIP